MKPDILRNYPEQVAKCHHLRENNSTLTDIWLDIFSDNHIPITRCTKIVEAALDLSQDAAQSLQEQSLALLTAKYKKMRDVGATPDNIFRNSLIETQRIGFCVDLIRKLYKLKFPDEYSVVSKVFKATPHLRQLNLWRASDHVIGVPHEISEHPSNHFYVAADDVTDRWRIIGFFLSPDNNYLTMRFCTFSDDNEIEDVYELNGLEESIFASFQLKKDLLKALIKIAEEEAKQLVEKPSAHPTFKELNDEEKAFYNFNFPHELNRTVFLQTQNPGSEKKTFLCLSGSSNGVFMTTIQLGDDEKFSPNDRSLGILHVDRNQADELAILLQQFV